MMNAINFKTFKLLLMGLCFTVSTYGSILATKNPSFLADTGQSKGIKSYFLLQLSLETNPVDLENYLQGLAFQNHFQDFSTSQAQRINKLETAPAQLLNMAMMNALKGNLDLSAQLFNKLVLNDSVRNDELLLLGIDDLLSQIMLLKGDYDQALTYQQRVLELALAAPSPSARAQSLLQMGKIESLLGHHDKAEVYLVNKALSAYTRLKDQQSLVLCYREIADKYFRQELYPQSKWFYLQSLTLAKKIKYAPGTIAALVDLGEFKYEVGDYDLAFKDWKEAESLAIVSHDFPYLLKLKYNLQKTAKQLGNVAAEEKYAREFEQLKDILLNPVL